MSVFGPYKNRHRGEACVILGSGESLLRYKDPEPDIIRIGVNTVLFAGLDLHYHFIADPGQRTNPNSYISKHAKYDCFRPQIAKFYGTTLSSCLRGHAEAAGAIPYEFTSAPLVRIGNASIEDPDVKPYFSSNLDETPPAAAGSISFTALQFALWCGFSRIYLAGMDITSSRRYNEAPGQNPNNYVVQHHLTRWHQFKDWVGSAYDEVRIISLHPVGLKWMFEDYKPPKQTYRLHMLCPPNTGVGMGYAHCAFTAKVERLAPALTACGHTVYVYSHTDSDVECTEMVGVMDDATLARAYGDKYVNGGWRTQIPVCNIGDKCHKAYTENTITELRKRYQPRDFILCFYGHGNQAVADDFPDAIVVEPSVGTFKTFANYAAYETSFIRSYIDGLNHRKARWMDVVIPSIIDPEDFTYKETKSDYVLFIGRIDQYKSPQTAIEACKRAGVKLKIAGQGSLSSVGVKVVPDHVEMVGYADKEMRRELISNAKAVIIPSNFSEPNCFVCAEAAVSGTPVVCSDHSGLVDNVVHGVTGWRCSTMYQFVWGLQHLDEIDPRDCAKWGENYHVDRAVLRYEEWFAMLHGVYYGNDFYGADTTTTTGRLQYRQYP